MTIRILNPRHYITISRDNKDKTYFHFLHFVYI